MAAKKKPARVCVTFGDGERVCSTRASFLRNNEDDTRLVDRVRRMKVGQTYRGGGGAGESFTVKRTR